MPCERCEKLAKQRAFWGQWIKETENPKLRKQLEKTLDAVKGTAVLHRFEQHSSLQMPHPVRSGLDRARTLRPLSRRVDECFEKS